MARMYPDFRGKVVLITGATRGIGAALAQGFGARGAQLILTGTRPDHVESLNRELDAQGIGSTRYWAVDFANRDSLTEFVNRLAALDQIDVCINNAGVNRINPVDQLRPEDVDAMLDVNLRAPLLISRTVSAMMKRHGYGRIVNIASIWSVITKGGRSVYSATKFGLVGMTKTLAVELAGRGVLVNAVSPGFVLTELTASTLSPEEQHALAMQVPVGRFAEPSEITEVVVFLASDRNTYLTGQNIVVDGGFVCV